ncbi:hypothetical protein H4582DRAFT_2128560 [Lactarius indigo]|nr:hypothetical protein H4582DRAFT_2128560 [Lactarius indigo]
MFAAWTTKDLPKWPNKNICSPHHCTAADLVNEQLFFHVRDQGLSLPIQLTVFDWDKFASNYTIGEAEINISTFVERAGKEGLNTTLYLEYISIIHEFELFSDQEPKVGVQDRYTLCWLSTIRHAEETGETKSMARSAKDDLVRSAQVNQYPSLPAQRRPQRQSTHVLACKDHCLVAAPANHRLWEGLRNKSKITPQSLKHRLDSGNTHPRPTRRFTRPRMTASRYREQEASEARTVSESTPL